MGTPEQPDFDYIVIGSGAGGGPLAARLAEADYTVGLIEAGRAPQHDWSNVPVFHAFASEQPDMSWEFFVKHYEDEAFSERDTKKYLPDKGGVFYPRAGTLGGCTQHHAMITICPHDSDWQNIVDITGDQSWAPGKMREYFRKIERCGYVPRPPQGQPNPTGHGYDGWLSTAGLDLKLGLGDPEILKTIIDTALATWKEKKSGLLPDLIPRDPNDCQSAQFEGVAFAPLSTLDGRRAGARERIYGVVAKLPQNLVLKQAHLATKILFDENKRAIGVECWQGQHLYRADPNANGSQPEVTRYYCRREVILAGGAFNSPQLLMLSGIGDRQHLKDKNVPLVEHRPGVGKNLQDRYEIAIVSEMNRNWKVLKNATFQPPPTYNDTGDPCYVDWKDGKGVYTTNGSLVAVIMKSGSDVPDPDLFLFALAGNFRGYYPGYSRDVTRTKNYLSWLVLKAHTNNDKGYVRLKTNDPRDRPEINFNYFADENGPRDLEAVMTGVDFMRKVADRNPTIKEVYPGRDTSGDKLRDFIKVNAWGHHASCSNKMGRPDQLDAVVDSEFRVIGVQNLRVVDASVFPRIPGFFIVTPIYMIAEKAADRIIADAKSGAAGS